MSERSKTTIIVAVIGVIGTLTVAIITNSKQTPPRRNEEVPQSPQPKHDPPPAEPKLLIDDANPRVLYNMPGGGWRTDPSYDNLNSTQHYTYNPGSTATLNFRGEWTEVVYRRALGGALMRVTIDDQNKAEIDMGNDTGQEVSGQTSRFDSLGSGEHVIVLTHSGLHVEGRPRSPAATGNEPNGYFINLDGFYVSKAQN